MSEDRSNHRFRLPRTLILRGRSQFASLFHNGTIIKTSKLWLTYELLPQSPGEFKMGFAAKKQLANAVNRNRLRRQMREQFRLMQHEFMHITNQFHAGFHGILSARAPSLTSSEIRASLEHILNTLNNRLPKKPVSRG